VRTMISTIMCDRDFKVSYSTVGFPLENDIYPEGLRPDQKASILRSIISREKRRSDLKTVKKSEGRSRFIRIIKENILKRLQEDGHSSSWNEEGYHYLSCGKYGAREQDKDGNTRDVVYHCNQRKRCPVCSERYHLGKSYEKGRIASVVMLANNVKYLRKFELTLPDFIWDQVKGVDDMNAFKKAANKMLQRYYGCSMDKRGAYKDGSVGIHIQAHWYSSEECWKKKPHLHSYVIPLKLEKGKARLKRACGKLGYKKIEDVPGQLVVNVDHWLNRSDLRRLRRSWSRHVKRVCRELGYKKIKDIPDELVVHHDFVDPQKNLKDKGHPGFNFRYDQRSPGYDLWESVVRIDFDQELLIMAFNQAGYDYYAIWSFDDYVDQLLERLGLKATNSTYGWSRRFRRNATTLGVEVKEEKDGFSPEPELEIKTEYRREYEDRFDKKTGKIRTVKHLYVKAFSEPHEPASWREVDPWTVHGEEIWTGSKKRYLYGLATGKDPP